MKLFTASGAIGLAGLTVVLAGFRLSAQDVMITDPAWIDAESPPADTAPTFRSKVVCDYPVELAGGDQPGYVLLRVTVNAAGDRAGMFRQASHPACDEAAKVLGGTKYTPAIEDGKAVPVKVWYAAIFNPKSAQAGGADASPRLLVVAPVTVEKEKLGELKLPLTVPAKISLDAMSKVTAVVFDQAEMERFRPEVEESLARWRFAPARRQGVAVPADVALPFMIWGPEKAVPKVKTPAQVKKRERPNYPIEMRRQSVSGEVVVGFVIDEKGGVRDAKVVRSTNQAFEESAVECVLKWKFIPAQEDGKAVKSRMQVPIMFNLNSRS